MKPLDDLPDEFKSYLIGNNGIFIGSIEYYKAIYKLYYLRGVFVEIQMNSGGDTVERISHIKEKGIDKYINRVQLPDFF